jgi:hypothetical protein
MLNGKRYYAVCSRMKLPSYGPGSVPFSTHWPTWTRHSDSFSQYISQTIFTESVSAIGLTKRDVHQLPK